MEKSSQHYTLLSLGYVSGTLPNGLSVRHALTFGYAGCPDRLKENQQSQAHINHSIAQRADAYCTQLKLHGADHIALQSLPVEQMLR